MFLEPTFRGQRSGWIEVICGSMFSGKTEELIRRVRRANFANQKVVIFKPKTDNFSCDSTDNSSDSDSSRSRSNEKLPSQPQSYFMKNLFNNPNMVVPQAGNNFLNNPMAMNNMNMSQMNNMNHMNSFSAQKLNLNMGHVNMNMTNSAGK
jgi:hypothetical protein